MVVVLTRTKWNEHERPELFSKGVTIADMREVEFHGIRVRFGRVTRFELASAFEQAFNRSAETGQVRLLIKPGGFGIDLIVQPNTG
jgi:hypothetical protein